MRISDWSSDVCSSDLFAPARQRLQSPQRLGLAPRNAHPLPRLVGIVDVMGRIGEPLHLLIEPGAAPGLLELREHPGNNGREARHIGDPVLYLLFVERARATGGEERALGEMNAEPVIHRRLTARRFN